MTSQNPEVFFNDLYDSTHDKVLAYIIVKCGHTEDISDIFQETYLEIVNIIKKRGISYMKNPEAFVMAVAKRKVYKHYKLSERLRSLEKRCDFDEDGLSNDKAGEVSLEERFMTKETVGMAVDFLKKKDELTKKIFYLYYYMDKPIREIAGLLSIKESNVKNRLYRTINELRDYFLKKEGMV